ncbi:MAG: hypothetical protein PHS82_06335 [Lachnospiraceae bacterium]|nr:hypothetical protein [Lachnospiraceae bacterium]
MGDGKIHIPAKKRTKATGNQVVKIKEEAYNILIDLYNESSLSLMQLASTIIMQSVDNIVFDKEDEA